MHLSKMVSMALTPDEVNERVKMNKFPPDAQAVADDTPVYPYGLCLSLEDDQLKKLDLEVAECEVGDMVHLVCMAKVTSVSSREKQGGTCDRVELQITDIGCEDENREGKQALMSSEKRMEGRYSKKEKEAEDA